MHTILFDCPCHIFCSGPLSICLRVSHVGAWGLVGSHLGLPQCIPTFSAISYQFLSILGAPGWETTCLLGPSFWCLQLGIGGPHTKATLAINMKCAKTYGFLMKLCYCLATCHCHSSQHFWNLGSNMHLCLGLDNLMPNLGGTSWD